MVTYFIARDRQKYIPYLPVYLANMQQLELTHLDVYEDFNAGNHSINCTGQPFSQVSTDIDQHWLQVKRSSDPHIT